MERLVAVDDHDDVPPAYRGTPVGRLLAYHNLGAPHEEYDRAALLVGMCMDHRKRLRLPRNFAYVIRTAGASLRRSGFEVSFAVGVGGVRDVAVVGHSDCGMVGLPASREAFVDGLAEGAGWDPDAASEQFRESAPAYGIDDPVDATLSEVDRLRRRYPDVRVAPLHYRVEDHRLYLVRE